MVNFKKHLGKPLQRKAAIDPIIIYESLDRASDKGPLRPAQEHVLREWHEKRRGDRDLIVKLHTGQGKTLIGLLILHSKLHEGKGPAVYLCPNAYLVSQTCEQALQFGIPHATTVGELPQDFLNSKKILITTVHKLFNGLTRFGLGANSLSVGTIVVDDSHACIDDIRDAFHIRLPRDHDAYEALVQLFREDLRRQGAGTYAELAAGKQDAVLPVPYWKWIDRSDEVANILAGVSETEELKFAWPLLKNGLAECLCVVSGDQLEVSPYVPPLDFFGSYCGACHRVFMSATMTDDSFLVKGLRLGRDVIEKPLAYAGESWSGEKMILLPSLISSELTREAIVGHFAPRKDSRNVGIVALVPSFARSRDWKAYGAVVAGKADISARIEALRDGRCEEVLVIANRYDGIDLPDRTCRVLIVDSLPRRVSLTDRYLDECRYGSSAIAIKSTQIIEQGIGRAVRGERDYCAALLIGPDLVRHVCTSSTRLQFSPQTRKQIEIGFSVAEFAEVDAEDEPLAALRALITQLVMRDEGWKQYHAEQMRALGVTTATYPMLPILVLEAQADRQARAGRIDDAQATLQEIVDKHVSSDVDKGWYLQEMARLLHPVSRSKANDLQRAAYNRNRFLLRPESGVEVKRIQVVSEKRVGRVRGWLSRQGKYEEIRMAVDAIVDPLRFGASADSFERALQELGEALGLVCERPDKMWKEGPDNIWAVDARRYVLFECKNEVKESRAEIAKYEAGQMNNSIAWFRRHYPGVTVRSLIVIPCTKLAKGAAFSETVEVVRSGEVEELKRNARGFFREFATLDASDVSDNQIQVLLNSHNLGGGDLMTGYAVGVKVR